MSEFELEPIKGKIDLDKYIVNGRNPMRQMWQEYRKGNIKAPEVEDACLTYMLKNVKMFKPRSIDYYASPSILTAILVGMESNLSWLLQCQEYVGNEKERNDIFGVIGDIRGRISEVKSKLNSQKTTEQKTKDL